jgi:hypothetical protein
MFRRVLLDPRVKELFPKSEETVRRRRRVRKPIAGTCISRRNTACDVRQFIRFGRQASILPL